VSDAERLADILRYSPGGCILVEQGEIKGANNEAVDISGIPRKRLVGASLAELAIDEEQPRIGTALVNATDQVSAIRMRLAAGLRPVELSLRRVNQTLILVGIRSVAIEHELSATAGGELTHDQVTGLPNRQHVLEHLQRRLNVPSGQPLALVGLWIDDYDSLNDQGQRVSDRIMRQVGERVQARLRGPDMLGRFEASGFLVLLTTDAELETLKEIADRLRDEVSFPVEFNGTLVSFTSSVLVGSVSTKRPSMERVLTRLEAMSRMAATGGGNRTDIFSL